MKPVMLVKLYFARYFLGLHPSRESDCLQEKILKAVCVCIKIYQKEINKNKLQVKNSQNEVSQSR